MLIRSSDVMSRKVFLISVIEGQWVARLINLHSLFSHVLTETTIGLLESSITQPRKQPRDELTFQGQMLFNRQRLVYSYFLDLGRNSDFISCHLIHINCFCKFITFCILHADRKEGWEAGVNCTSSGLFMFFFYVFNWIKANH